MTTSGTTNLGDAIRTHLLSDTPLTALLGGPRVYDEPPKSIAFPYVTLGETRVADWSTGTEPGEEHHLTRLPSIASSISASRSPTCAVKPMDAPTTRWCGSVPSLEPMNRAAEN